MFSLSRFPWLTARRWLAGFVLACLALGPATSAATNLPTFAEWRTAIAGLPMNRALELGGPPRDRLPLKSFAEFERALDAVVALATNGPLTESTRWVGPAPDRSTFFDVSRGWFLDSGPAFEPFVQKLVLPASARVFLEGDLHGDIHSLMAVLSRLNERRWLDGFTIIEPGLHLIFLGDYTDRGQYGVEVLYTLLRLRLANPERVHCVRGNHEDLSLVSRYGFLAEGRTKYGREFNAAKILRWYDFFPVALYLGSGRDFVQLCHGGMEPGYSPAALLAAAGTNQYQRLGPLRQAEFLRRNPEWLRGDPGAAEAKRYLRDFTPTAPTQPTVLGFMWNDFSLFRDEPGFANNPDRAFIYGRTATQYLLEHAAGSDGGARVHAVFRAHQHSSLPNPMMRRLLASHGLFRHWQETNSAAAQTAGSADLAPKLETAPERPLPEGSVWTFNVAPDSTYGAGCNFNFVTWGILRFGAAFADWRITVEPLRVPRLN